MMDSILILGRQPALGRAELESLYGAAAVLPIAENIVQLKRPAAEVDFNRLGGSVKLAKLLTTLPTTHWPKLAQYLSNSLPEHVQHLPEGKLKLGLSVYELPIKAAEVSRTALSLKQITSKAGRSTRVVPNQLPTLNSAQVLHNQLTGPLGMELVLIGHGKETLLAQTVAEQDIEAYTARDQVRPKRDAKVGMLPPKLAQIIINLARPEAEGVILDPFCGTGVVLQEALLMGFAAYGSDLDERMVEFTRENVITWLLNGEETGRVTIEHGDATSFTWQNPFDAVASEVYLGQPFSSLPHPDKLKEVVQTCNTITKKFLQNLASQTSTGFRLCLAVPAWKTPQGFIHLPTLEKLSDMGYNRLSFVHAQPTELVYHRPEQIVARELVTLIRK